VDGIYTADPRKVPTARLIPIISPEEAAELTYYGSEVVHAFAMEQVCHYCSGFFDCTSTVLLATVQAIREMIPVRVKNVQNPKGGGTVIYPDPDVDTTREGFVSTSDEPDLSLNPLALLHDHRKNEKLPTAVTIKEHIMVLNVHSNRKRVSHGFLAGIFETLDRFGVVVDLISTSEVHVSMAIYEGQAKKVLDRLISDLRKSGKVNLGAIFLS
jgi:aspartate kinase